VPISTVAKNLYLNEKTISILNNTLFLIPFQIGICQNAIPHLIKKGNATQLIIEDKPYIILGGELGNSTATTVQNMQTVWAKMKIMNLNTALIPVYWELIESQEGVFDFSLYQDLIVEARKNDIKIIFLWFGVWKNSMSSHAPAWVKHNQEKYPRAKDNTGRSQDILSAFSAFVFYNLNIYLFLIFFYLNHLIEQYHISFVPTYEGHLGKHNLQVQYDFSKS
jgi:Glycosyl hydrolases family 35